MREEEVVKNLIVYFAFKVRNLTMTKLVKLIYLADFYHLERTKKRITNLRFVNWHYGPYSPAIPNTTEEISGSDIEVRSIITSEGYDAHVIKPIVKETEVKLPKDVVSTLQEIVKDWGEKNTEDIIRDAKSTPPYRSSKFGEEIFEREDAKIYRELPKREKFMKIYSNLPINLREEIIAVIKDKPISWHAAYLEVEGGTKLGEEILNRLKKMQII